MSTPGVGRSQDEYLLIVRGELDRRLDHLFEPMRVERTPGRTVFIGSVIDQAHLHGVLEQIAGLGLDLLSVEQVTSAS